MVIFISNIKRINEQRSGRILNTGHISYDCASISSTPLWLPPCRHDWSRWMEYDNLRHVEMKVSQIFIFEMCLIIQFLSAAGSDEVTPLWSLGCSISPFQLSDSTDTTIISARLPRPSRSLPNFDIDDIFYSQYQPPRISTWNWDACHLHWALPVRSDKYLVFNLHYHRTLLMCSSDKLSQYWLTQSEAVIMSTNEAWSSGRITRTKRYKIFVSSDKACETGAHFCRFCKQASQFLIERLWLFVNSLKFLKFESPCGS